ncbi:MAG: hypothetical protein J0L87_00125 [Bacteroidetes bacterium]|nr:hypothetical protein [Bacteroidota bacterium]
MKVLVLEKEQIVKKDIEHQLKKNGFIPTDSKDKEAAIVIIGQLSFLNEVILMQAELPLNTKYIFLTGHFKEYFTKELEQFGKAIFVQKPIAAETVIKIIKELSIKDLS